MAIKPDDLNPPPPPAADPPAGLPVEGGLVQPDPPAPAGNGLTVPTEGIVTGKTFTAEDIERARREEKDKLYGEIGGLKEELKAIKTERQKANEAFEAAAKAEADKAAAAEAAAKKKAEEEMGLKELLDQKQQEWENRFASIESERAMERELLAKERRFTELSQYRMARIEAEADSIMPELRDFVAVGPDEATIDASIANVQQRTAAILQQLTAAQQAARMGQRGTTVTAPPVGALESAQEFQNLTPDDLKNMDFATYAKNRDRLLGAVSQQVRQQGLYGR
jgi:hypothetical protein